jgi:hypothetical protein
MISIQSPEPLLPVCGAVWPTPVSDPARHGFPLGVLTGRLRTNIGNVAALDDAVAAFNPTERIKGKTIMRVHP